MIWLAALGGGVFVLVSLVLGPRLLALARRSAASKGGAALCEGIARALLAQSLEAAPSGESPEAIFQRLGGR